MVSAINKLIENIKKEEKEEATTYPVTSPVVMDTVINKEYVAQIQSVKNIEVRAQEKGFLEKQAYTIPVYLK